MNDKQPYKPYADLAVVTGKYLKDGKEKNRYHKVGVMFATPHLSSMFIRLDSLPLDSKITVFKRDDFQPEEKLDEVHDVPDGPINLSDIPF
jgi:hypothetical protein